MGKKCFKCDDTDTVDQYVIIDGKDVIQPICQKHFTEERAKRKLIEVVEEKTKDERIKELEAKARECKNCGKGNYDCLSDLESGNGICCSKCDHSK